MSTLAACLTPDQREAALRDIGARRYHRLHPFHKRLHGGPCSKGEVQAWSLNRCYCRRRPTTGCIIQATSRHFCVEGFGRDL